MENRYKIKIDKWGKITIIKNLTQTEVIGIALGARHNDQKYLNARIEIQGDDGDCQIIDTTDDFVLFDREFAPGF